MTDRDRLKEKIDYLQKVFMEDDDYDYFNEFLADRLLADKDIIVPPCKVGETVYVIEPCSCFCGYRTFEECHHRRTNATKWIEAVMVANKHHNRCMKLFERPYKPEYYFKIGKWVFLTKEEAEAELRKRSEDNG